MSRQKRRSQWKGFNKVACLINRVQYGDATHKMQQFVKAGIRARCCVTSPPYYGLRDYGVPGQIGLEETINAYVDRLVLLFAGVWDVLTDDGTLWLNLGDSYTGSGGPGSQYDQQTKGTRARFVNPTRRVDTLQPKNLLGVPWRVAFALQASDWILRADIIWAKPNPMPQPVKDRPTISHEYIFLFAKQQKYYYDADAIMEEGVIPAGSKGAQGAQRRAEEICVNARPPVPWTYTGKRNKRSVWTVQTRPYTGAHFATFPPALIEPCILAGSEPGDIVLDPFMGSGTTAEVAQRLGRRWIGCELNEKYRALIEERTAQKGLL